MQLKSTYLCQRDATFSKSEPLPSGRCIVTLLSCNPCMWSAFLRVLKVRQALYLARSMTILRGSSRQWWCCWCWCAGAGAGAVPGGAAAAVGRRRGHRRCCLLGMLVTGSPKLPPDKENSPLSHGTNGVPPPDGADCNLPSLTARASRHYIARKTGNHYTEE